MWTVAAVASEAAAFDAAELAISQKCESAVGITTKHFVVTAIVIEDVTEVVATPFVPPAVIAAESTAAESREVGEGLALWAVDFAALVSAVCMAAAELTLPDLVKAAVCVDAHHAIPAASCVSAEPLLEASSMAIADPAMIAAHTQLAEAREASVASALDLALEASATSKGVGDADSFTGVQWRIHVCRLDTSLPDRDIFDRRVGGIAEEFLGIADRRIAKVVEVQFA